MKLLSNKLFMVIALVSIALVNVALNESPVSAGPIEIRGEEKLVKHDYLDFSYIGYMIQILIGSLFATLFALRRYYGSIISFMKNIFRSENKRHQ